MRDIVIIVALIALALFGASHSARFSGTATSTPATLSGVSVEGSKVPSEDVLGTGVADTETLTGTDASSSSTSTVATSLPSGTPTSDTLVVRDQPAGGTVIVESMTLSKPGWVAIREEKDGKPANTLGAAYREATTSRGVIVELLRETIPGMHYYAELQDDNGDGVYSVHDDSPVTDTMGNPLIMQFDTFAQQSPQ